MVARPRAEDLVHQERDPDEWPKSTKLGKHKRRFQLGGADVSKPPREGAAAWPQLVLACSSASRFLDREVQMYGSEICEICEVEIGCTCTYYTPSTVAGGENISRRKGNSSAPLLTGNTTVTFFRYAHSHLPRRQVRPTRPESRACSKREGRCGSHVRTWAWIREPCTLDRRPRGDGRGGSAPCSNFM